MRRRPNILRKVEQDGAWWGQRPDGTWVRWDHAAGDWSAPTGPPAGLEPALPRADPREGRVATFGGVRVVEGEPRQNEATGSLDIRIPWLDERFPPGSNARLILLLVATPIIGGLVELYGRFKGEPMSLGRWIFVTIATMAVVMVAFHLHRRRTTGHAATPQDETTRQASPYRPRLRDFLIGIPIGFVGILAWEAVLMGIADTLSPMNVAATAVGAVVLSAVIVLRYTVWSLIIVSLLLGAGGALFVMLFFSVWGTDTGFLEAWVVCSLLAATAAAPFWFALRRAATRGGGPFPGPQGHTSRWTELPTPWLLAGSLALMFLFAVVMRATGEL